MTKKITITRCQKGFGLIEAALVLAAGAVFTVGGLTLYMSGHSNANIEKQVQFVSKLDNKVHSVYGISSISSLKAITGKSLISANIIPKNKVYNNNNIIAYIGSQRTSIQGFNYKNHAYILYGVNNLNRQQCVYYGRLASNNFNLVSVNHSHQTRFNSSQVLQNTTNNKKLKPNNLVNSCNNSNDTVIVANNYGSLNNKPLALNVSSSSSTSSTNSLSQSSPSTTSSSSTVASSSTTTSSPTSTSSTSSPTTTSSTTTSSTSSSTTSTSSPTTTTATSSSTTSSSPTTTSSSTSTSSSSSSSSSSTSAPSPPPKKTNISTKKVMLVSNGGYKHRMIATVKPPTCTNGRSPKISVSNNKITVVNSGMPSFWLLTVSGLKYPSFNRLIAYVSVKTYCQ